MITTFVQPLGLRLFDQCLPSVDAATDGNRFSLEQAFAVRLGSLKVPVIRGLMIGHVKGQTIVPIGGMAELDADAEKLMRLSAVVG